jgi:hypothetical protein
VRVFAHSFSLILLIPTIVVFAACGARPRVTLPTGTGTAFPEFSHAFTEATTECRAVKKLSATIRLSGRAGRTKLAARIDSGFADPAQIRLEGYPRVSFGGKPFFILVSRGAEATLVMPRDARVLRGAAPAAIVEALAGVALGPDDLRAIVAGCGLQSADPSSGRSFANGWAAIDAGETSLFLRQMEGRWRVAGATRGPLSVAYGDFAAGRAATVQVSTPAGAGSAGADLVLRLSELEIDPPLEERVFEVEVPADATPLTLEELRRAGPLGEQSTEAAESTEKFQHGGAEARRRMESVWSGRAARGDRARSLRDASPATSEPGLCLGDPGLCFYGGQRPPSRPLFSETLTSRRANQSSPDIDACHEPAGYLRVSPRPPVSVVAFVRDLRPLSSLVPIDPVSSQSA